MLRLVKVRIIENKPQEECYLFCSGSHPVWLVRNLGWMGGAVRTSIPICVKYGMSLLTATFFARGEVPIGV